MDDESGETTQELRPRDRRRKRWVRDGETGYEVDGELARETRRGIWKGTISYS